MSPGRKETNVPKRSLPLSADHSLLHTERSIRDEKRCKQNNLSKSSTKSKNNH